MRPDKPIIQSFLWQDFYKFTMGYFVWKLYRDVQVRYAFKNRTTGIHLGNLVDIGQLREELDHIRTLQITRSEYHYLRGTFEYGKKMFEDEYLDFLRDLRMPDYHLEIVEGQLVLEFEGPWSTAIYWEIFSLVIVQTLLNRTVLERHSRFQKDTVRAEGIRRLAEKIEILKGRPDIIFSDFGTRRAFSPEWQEYVVRTLAEELPGGFQFLGTSNVWLAMQYGLVPMGTNAHECGMVIAALLDNDADGNGVRAAQSTMLQEWWDLYGHGLSIALTDTFGTEAFFRSFTPAQASRWKGFRQDSGDVMTFITRAIEFYGTCGLSSAEIRSKLIVPSDGLELPLMVKVADAFKDRIKLSFGWGTNLTNDLGFRTLSIVVKAIMANGRGTVKLSDNPAKAMGRPEDVARYMKIFDYREHEFVECKY